ncbi:MAG: glycosyltransferase [Treponema sp.]|uniref:glycosyltransferase family 2 protein n=1 Tax=Treponema sp. TaxID=166 RepID=UPI00298D92A4|nr:glycosyltransferase [Treponema sp.]MCQ2601579.1 glycosyltransferase [Treponema sp.]
MQSNTPLFSVIIPIYKVESYLVQCLDSVLNQTFTDYECILVDDGSPDNCPTICDDYVNKDSRFRVIHKKNGGQGAARKDGCNLAMGEYLVFLDSDDWFAPDYLKCFATEIQTNSPEVLITGCIWWTSENDFIECPVDKNVFFESLEAGFYNRDRIESVIFPKLLETQDSTNIQSSVWAKAFKRELYIPFQDSVDLSIRMGEDTAVVKPVIAASEKISVLSNCDYFYRQLQSSMTRSASAYNWNAPEIISLHLENKLQPHTEYFQSQIYRFCVHQLFNVCVYKFYQDKSYKQISAEIKTEISRPYYKKAVKSTKFNFGSKGWLAHKALKYRLFLLMKIFSKIK